MFPVFASVLRTPLLKIPIIVSDVLSTHLATTPPNPPPKSTETEKYGSPDFASVAGRAVMNWIRPIMWCNAFSEIAVILANQYPSSFSDRLLSFIPGPRTTASAVRIRPIFLVGSLLIILGSLFRLSCYRTLGKFFTWELSVKQDHRLVTVGPYSVVRHPSYTSVILIGFGHALSFLSAGAWWTECGFMASAWGEILAYMYAGFWAFIPLLIIRRVDREDTTLRKEFGDEWDSWAKKTPFKLAPLIY